MHWDQPAVHLHARDDADPFEKPRERFTAAGSLLERLLEHDHATNEVLDAGGREQQASVSPSRLLR
jgi:hypothetical protein